MTARGMTEEIYKVYSTPKFKLGALIELPTGERYRFGKNGVVQLNQARLVQSVVPVVAHTNIAVQAAAAVGALTISISLGATAVVANEYADGYVYVNDAGADTTTEGYRYRIKSHPAAALSTTLVLTLYEDTPVKIALTTNSEVSLVRNKFSGVIIHPSPPTGICAGVTMCVVPASYYCWLQTKGPCCVLTEGTLVQARSCMPSGTTDGAVAPLTLTEATPNTELQYVVGRVWSVNATTEQSLIDLCLE